MKTKKSLFHYMAYVLFALIFFCSIAMYAVNIVEMNNSADYLIPVVLRYLIVVAGILVFIYGYQLLLKYLPSKYKNFKLPEISLIVKIGIIFLLFIVFCFPRLISISNAIGEHEISPWLDYALYNTQNLPDTSMLSFIYGSLLRVFTSIIDSEFIVYTINLVFEIGVVVFTFLMLEENLGLIVAVIASFILSVMPGLSLQCTKVTPSVFFTLLISAYFYILFHLIKMNLSRKIDSEGKIILFILLGILGGFILCLDVSGIVIPILTIAVLIMLRNKEPNFKSCSCVTQSIVTTITEICTCLVVLFFVNNNGLLKAVNITNYFNSFVPNGLSLDIYPAFDLVPVGIILYIFVGIAILSFIRNADDLGFVYVVIADIATVCIFVLFNNSEYSYVINYSWVILATFGLISIPTFVLTEEEQRASEKKKIENEKKKEQRKYKKQFAKDKSSGNKSISLEMTDEIVEEETNVSIVPTPDKSNFNTSEDSKEEMISIDNENTNDSRSMIKVVEAPPEIPKDLNMPREDYSNLTSHTIVKKEATENISAVIPESAEDGDRINTKNNVKVSDEKEDVVAVTPVFSEPVEKPSNIIPSRREYKTAHVYRSEEEKIEHEDRMKTAPVNNSVPAELKEKAGFIKNPLPTPKPHVTRELAYDYDLSPSEMDFDITDMKGKDFYDI